MIKRIAFSVVATLVLLLPAAPSVHAVSCKGASHAITLSVGASSPRTGTTATGITFSVHYSSNAGCAPSAVTVDIAGVGTYPLASGGSDFSGGETFSRTMTLPAGVHTYTFSATGGTGTGEQSIILTSVNPDSVAITSPTPLPTPSPTPVPPPPAPTAPPAPPAPPAAPPPAAPPAAPVPPGGPSATPAPATTGAASAPSTAPEPGTPAATDPAGDSAPVPPATSGKATEEHDSWIVAPIFGGGGSTSPDKGALLGDDSGGSAMGPLLSVTTAMGMVLVAVLVARRRPRHDVPVPAGLAAAADPAIPAIPISVPIPDDGRVPAVRPLPPMRELVPPVNAALLDEERADDAGEGRTGAPDEQGIPRWLRPSVREARFANDRDHRRSNWG